MTHIHSSSGIAPGHSKAFSPAVRRRLVRLIIVSLLLPLSFEIANIRFTPSLLLMIALAPFLFQQYLSGVVRWRAPDLLFLLYILWQALTILLNNPERFVTFTGQQTLLTLAGYLAGRLLVLEKQDFISFILFWAAASMVSVPFAMYEAIRDDPIILRMILDYTPFGSMRLNDYEPRLGLYRAQFVFVHPIHYGLMGALVLMPYWLGLASQIAAAKRTLGALLIFLATFLSVSSGAVLSIALQVGVFISHRIAALMGPPWRILLASGAVFYLVVELLSNKSAFAAISGRLAFNSATAYYRTLIWEYGSAQVMRTPIFGNGYNYWARPFWMTNSSVDNHWLLLAMVHGLPALVLFASSLLYAFFAVNRIKLFGDTELDRMRLAWTLALIGFCMSASTVAIWGEIQMFFMLLFGAGFWLASTGPGNAQETTENLEETSRHLPYSRYSTRRSGDAEQRRPARVSSSRRVPNQFSRKDI